MNGGKLWRFYENCKAYGYTFALSPAGAVEVTEYVGIGIMNPGLPEDYGKDQT